MTRTPLDAIMPALAAAGVGSTTAGDDWYLYAAYMAAAPNRAICIYPAGGRAPEAGQPVKYPQVQIAVRGNRDDAEAVLEKMQEIYDTLHSCDAPAVLGTGYVWIYAIQNMPIPLGQDENRRPTFATNYRIMMGA